MRNVENINKGWTFQIADKPTVAVDVPHTWNALDGQDGGNDYYRGTGVYEKHLSCPSFDRKTEEVYLEFQGVNASARVFWNGQEVGTHDGGYSTFRFRITELLQEDNLLRVEADNSVNDRVYPQKADFTFYGGIYRDVNLLVVSKDHFELTYYGMPGLLITPVVKEETGEVTVEAYAHLTGDASQYQVHMELFDADGHLKEEARAGLTEFVWEDVENGTLLASRYDAGHRAHHVFCLKQPRLWDGRVDPYLYVMKCTLEKQNEELDVVQSTFGVRSFHVYPDRGFYLNGRSYPLRGVSRHQDFKGLGNAIPKTQHDEDMALIKEMGANTIRLAHYQHDQYFYDLCDKEGMVVWAEIPYISEHMPAGRANTLSQMKELILQNYNHASIVTWGLSNEITISTKDKRDMLDNHRALNDLCHHYDTTRPTTLACYAMCNPFGRVVHISDLVSYNLYLGWYVPGKFLNDIFFVIFHTRYPKRCLGYSEYGAEGMPNLHSEHPRRGDHTEEYQARYHEYMIRCFARFPWLWATHVWNMFDFAADARDQGGEPGMNHKGLVTFDRKTKKDSFYLYKCYWNPEPMVHICSKRFAERGSKSITVRVYSNQNKVQLYCNDTLVEEKTGDHVFIFRAPLSMGENRIRAVAGEATDEAVFTRLEHPRSYKLEKKRSKSANWV